MVRVRSDQHRLHSPLSLTALLVGFSGSCSVHWSAHRLAAPLSQSSHALEGACSVSAPCIPTKHSSSDQLLRRYAMREALAIVAEEGLEAIWQRHALMHQRLWQGLGSLGLQPLVADPTHRLPSVNAIQVRGLLCGASAGLDSFQPAGTSLQQHAQAGR